VGGYFKDPTGTSKQVGSNMQGSGEALALSKDDMPRLKEELQNKVRQLRQAEGSHRDNGDSGGLANRTHGVGSGDVLRKWKSNPHSERPRDAGGASSRTGKVAQQDPHQGAHGRKAIRPRQQLRELGTLGRSCQRGRRLMQQSGVNADQVVQIRGYADQQLRKANSPEDPSNRRISLIIQYLVKDAGK